MKKIFFLLLLTPIMCYCQDTKNFEFTLIDSVQATKDELYVYAKSWMATTFVSSKSVIEMEDKEAGKIIGNGEFVQRENSLFGNQVGVSIISFTITVDVKDNKYRCILSDFFHKYIQTASTYIPGQTATNAASASLGGNRVGGPLNNTNPPGNVPKKWWQKIKEITKEESLVVLDKLKKSMHEGRSKNDF